MNKMYARVDKKKSRKKNSSPSPEQLTAQIEKIHDTAVTHAQEDGMEMDHLHPRLEGGGGNRGREGIDFSGNHYADNQV